MDINLAIADRARAGETLTAAELDELAAADLLSLGMLADEVRRSRVGDSVTYVRVFEWPAMNAPADKAREVRIAALPESLDEAITLVKKGRQVAEGRPLSAFSLADIIDRGWAPLADVLG